MALKYVLLLLALTGLIMSSAIESRDHPLPVMHKANSSGIYDCWIAISEMRACSNEIVQFFLNGQNAIARDCCSTISTIVDDCWPPMYSALGFTADEEKILKGYCGNASNSPHAAPATPAASPIST